MKEHARQRRRDKRELAALHQALAEQEGNQGSGRGGRGAAEGGGGGVEHAGMDGSVGEGVGSNGKEDGVDGRADNLSNAGGESTARTVSPFPAADTLPIETNAKQDSTVIGARASVGGQATLAPRSAPQDTRAAPRREENSPPRDERRTSDGASSPSQSDTTLSRRALLVRLGFVRARLEAGGSEGDEGGGLRPVAESLRREVEELAKSGAGAAAAGGQRWDRGSSGSKTVQHNSANIPKR